MSTWNQLSRLTILLKTWTILELQPTLLTDLTSNIGTVLKCIRQVRLNFPTQKCLFGVKKVEFLNKTISSEGILPQTYKKQKLLNKLRFTKSKKGLERYLGFVNYNKNYIPRMVEKLNPSYRLLKAEVPINIT